MRSWACLLPLVACHRPDPEGFVEVPCTPEQAAPYPDGLPYVGIHGNAANDDVVDCALGERFGRAWHALKGHAVLQPSTLSPDGRTVYVTATNPDPQGCTLFALDAEDGSVAWCETVPPDAAASAVEVDEDGGLFLTAGGRVWAFDADGAPRWTAPLWPDPAAPVPADTAPYAAYGLHFTPDGHVVTVTAEGLVVLLDRNSGARLAAMDLPEAFGLVPPEPSLLADLDLLALLPTSVIDDATALFGDRAGEALGSFFGAGGAFSDNTIAVSPRGELYVIGGGPDPDHGALVQVRVAPGPMLQPGWLAVTRPGSAATPSVSRDGRWVVTSDGAATTSLTNPDQADAAIVAVDVDACDANTDADPDPERCGVAWEHPLQRGPMAGAPALDPDGTVWFWEISLSLSGEPGARDLAAVGPDGVHAEWVLPDDAEWTSVITLTDRHLAGAISRVEPSTTQLATLTLPATATHEIVLVDRATGSIAFHAPIPDDSAATVAVGPDGSLYVGMLGIVSMLALEDTPELGLIRFRPTAGR